MGLVSTLVAIKGVVGIQEVILEVDIRVARRLVVIALEVGRLEVRRLEVRMLKVGMLKVIELEVTYLHQDYQMDHLIHPLVGFEQEVGYRLELGHQR